MDELSTIYRIHHQKGNRYGFGIYEEERGRFFSEMIGKGKKILDLGCRDGNLTKYYLLGNEVIGIDIDKEALRVAQEKLGFKTLYLDLNGDWMELNEQKFDVVVSGEILEHLYYPVMVLTKAYRLLNPGGLLVGSVPNAFRWPNRLRFLFGSKKGTSLSDPTHINHFSQKELEKILEETGFKDIVSKPIVKKKYAWFEKLFPGSFSYIIMFKARTQ